MAPFYKELSFSSSLQCTVFCIIEDVLFISKSESQDHPASSMLTVKLAIYKLFQFNHRGNFRMYILNPESSQSFSFYGDHILTCHFILWGMIARFGLIFVNFIHGKRKWISLLVVLFWVICPTVLLIAFGKRDRFDLCLSQKH